MSSSLEIVGFEQWSDLRSVWVELHAQSGMPSFFLSPFWMDAWLSTFGQQLDVRFACLKDVNEIVGLALFCERRRTRGPFTITELYLNTAGEGEDSPSVECNRILCKPEYAARFAQELRHYLASRSWDEIYLNGMIDTDTPFLPAESYCLDRCVVRQAPYVELTVFNGDREQYLASRSANTRYQIRRSLKRYEERGAVVLEVCETLSDATDMYEELVRLHRQTWAARNQRGTFASTVNRRFHEHLIDAAFPQGQIQFWKVSCAGDVIGVLYLFCFDGRLSYYQSGLNYEEDKHLKPGLICHALAIAHAIDHGFIEYDFLSAGNDGARYKTSLSNATRPYNWSRFKRISFKNTVLEQIASVRKLLTT